MDRGGIFVFTGLVETTGRARSLRRAGAVYTLSVEAPTLAPELVLGQSVSVSGACLTVTALHGDGFEVEIMPETLKRTWFGEGLKTGTRVNLERAMRLGDRLDGHLVLGHVDGVAKLTGLSGGERTRSASFSVPPDLARGIVGKGSVALDGVSLTVIEAGDDFFSVGLIPTTLASCTLGDLKPGMGVNLETDILGKYVERLLNGPKRGGAPESPSGHFLSIEELTRLGY